MLIFKNYGIAAFWILASADIALIMMQLETYRVFTKPLLIPVLLLTIFSRINRGRHGTAKLIMATALLLATAGDILLLASDRPEYFIAGLLSFLLMQVLYSVYFLRIKPFKAKHFISISASFLLVAFIAGALCYLLWNRLENFRTPLMVYGFFLALMFSAAVNIYHSRATSSLAIATFIPGAALFILSDLILAANMFYFKEPFIAIAVMSTYCGAQYYIARGFIKHLR